jgi:hypothetical protein
MSYQLATCADTKVSIANLVNSVRQAKKYWVPITGADLVHVQVTYSHFLKAVFAASYHYGATAICTYHFDGEDLILKRIDKP